MIEHLFIFDLSNPLNERDLQSDDGLRIKKEY